MISLIEKRTCFNIEEKMRENLASQQWVVFLLSHSLAHNQMKSEMLIPEEEEKGEKTSSKVRVDTNKMCLLLSLRREIQRTTKITTTATTTTTTTKKKVSARIILYVHQMGNC